MSDQIKDFKFHRGSLPGLLDMMLKIVLSGLSYRISIVEWSDKRGLSANAQQHVWYNRISQFNGYDIRTAGNQSKLDFGLPILLSANDIGPQVDFLLKKIGIYSFSI